MASGGAAAWLGMETLLHAEQGAPLVSLPVVIAGGLAASALGAAADLFGFGGRKKGGKATVLAHSIWAVRKTLEEFEIIRRGKSQNSPEGIYLGTFTDNVGMSEIRYYGEKHLLYFGAPGAFKSTGLVVPALASLHR
jgi:hypothetical protein